MSNKKTAELAEKLMDELDQADLDDAVKMFPKCRSYGEDLDNATDHVLGIAMRDREVPKGIDEDELVSELEDLIRDKLKKTPKK